MEGPNSCRRICFGLFEVDLATGELHKQGRRLKLPEQPFQVLAALLEKPGELVTRDELRRRIWSDDTFVDFDHSLNKAVNKVREALGDSSSNPRFAETLPRRGYRFIAPVDGGQPVAAETPAPTKRSRLWIGGVVAVAIIAAATGWLASRRDTATAPLKVEPLTSYVGVEAHASFSPDGSEVAFTWGRDYNSNYDIYIKQIGVDQPSQFTDHPAHEFGPAWSPKGTHIAFLRFLPPSKFQVILKPQRGGPEEILIEFPKRDFARPPQLDSLLAWTPDGRWIVTEGRNDERQPRSLFLVSVSTRQRRQLTWPEPTQHDTSPAVSPDGRSLVFARRYGAHLSELYLLHLSADMTPTGNPIKLPSVDVENHQPAWTADGKEIVFAAAKFWNDSLWRMQPSPSATPRPLGITGGSNRQPAISRAGDRLAFTKLRGNFDIWKLELASKDGDTLTPAPFLDSTHHDSAPDYSPNGQRIAFASVRSGSPEVWLSNADGTHPVPLTSFGGPKVISPKWSPNGEQIAFYSEVDGNSEIYTISVKERKIKRLTNHPAWDGNPRWSRDGKWIYFISERSGTYAAWKVPAAGGDAVALSGPLSDVRDDGTPIESPDGKYLYYLSGDSAWRIPAEGGEAVPIVEELFHRGSLAVFDDGLYYVGKADEDGAYPIRFKDFASGRDDTLGKISGEAFSNLAVSPDRRTLLFVQDAEAEGDLMLIENFR